ncbi:MAG: tetratricopeptide repeat protein, partial [Bacteroidota bacterium]
RVSANAVGPGDSGGPLLDTEGRVLGVVVSGRNTRGDDNLLRQDLCLTTDLRPALAALAAREAPRPLRASLALLEASAPHAQMLRAVASLQAGRARGRDRSDARPILADLLDAAARTQQDPAMLFLLGTTLDFVGDQAAAAEAFADALDHADGFFPAAYALGHHHLRNGQFDEADAYFRRTADHPGYRHLAALGLARSHAERFDYTAAIEALQPVLHHDPDYAPALYLLAYAHLGLGDEATAEALLVRLQHRDAYWAERLALNLRAQALRPTALHAVSGP